MSSIYQQNVSGSGNNFSQTGPVTVTEMKSSELAGLSAELVSLRAGLRATPPSEDGDEAMGYLAQAQKAADGGDTHAVGRALSGIPAAGWKAIKALGLKVGSGIILHYLEQHGLG